MNIKLALFLLLLAVTIFGQTDTVSLIGKPAPQFRLANLNSQEPASFALTDWFAPDSGHAVIVSFFATWCAPCRQELPFLQTMVDSLAGNGLRMVAVCVDSAYGEKQKMMVAQARLTGPVVHDKFGIIARRFECGKALPYTVFINRKGLVAAVSVGYDAAKNAGIIHSINLILKEEH